MRSLRVAAVGLLAIGLSSAVASAGTLYVDSLGDSGWVSRDTRSFGGTNLVSPSDDPAIDSVIQFGAAPSGGAYADALHLITPSSNSAKASIGVSSTTTGFAAGDALLNFSAQYQWFTEGPPTYTSRTSPLKIGIQTSNYATTPAGATRTGDNDWDMLLVQLPPSVAGTWNTESIDFDTGLWYVVQRGGTFGNTYSNPVSPLAGLTLEQIYNSGNGFNNDIDLANIFSASSKISVIEFGLGSGQQNASNYITYLQTSVYNGGDAVVFSAAPVPLPSAAAMGLPTLLALGLYRRRSMTQ